MNTRARILDATEHVITERGLARATTKEIARAAGVAEATLFKYFDRKEDLLLAAVHAHVPAFVAVVQPDQAGTRPLDTQLQAITQAAMAYYAHLLPLTIALCADAALLARHREWMQAQQAGPQRIYESVAAYIAAEQRVGRLDAARDPLSVAALLLGPAFQYTFLRYFMGADLLPGSEQAFVATLVQTLLAGVALRGG